MSAAIIGAVVALGSMVYDAVDDHQKEVEQNRLARKQEAEAKRLKEEAEANKKDYKVPEAVKSAVTDAERLANAESSYLRTGVEESDKNLANKSKQIERTATSGSQAVAAINEAVNERASEVNRTIMGNEQIKSAKQANLANAKMMLAQYQNEEYDKNVMHPYLQNMQYANQLESASIQNRFNAMNSRPNYSQAGAQLGATIGSMDWDSVFKRKK